MATNMYASVVPPGGDLSWHAGFVLTCRQSGENPNSVSLNGQFSGWILPRCVGYASCTLLTGMNYLPFDFERHSAAEIGPLEGALEDNLAEVENIFAHPDVQWQNIYVVCTRGACLSVQQWHVSIDAA